MKSTKEPCPLCSQPVQISGFRLETKEGQKDFCCEGCLSIYQLLNEDKLFTTTNEKKK
ncbi:MAG: heavy metal translocating P-type ATPase metal-binding domain-containing protein [Methylococcaceae bacterium]